MSNSVTHGRKARVAGNGHAAAALRRQRFIDAYLGNGHNATQAAITAGFSPKTACAQGQRLLRKVEISGEIARAAEQAALASGLERERALEEIAHISFFDVRKLFRHDGSLKDPSEWDAGNPPKTRVTKVKLWDKNAALDKAMKHLGLYKKGNAQRAPELSLQVVLVGPP